MQILANPYSPSWNSPLQYVTFHIVAVQFCFWFHYQISWCKWANIKLLRHIMEQWLCRVCLLCYVGEVNKGMAAFLEGQSSLMGTERLVYIKRFLCPSNEQKRKQKRQRLKSYSSIHTFQFVESLLLLAPCLRPVDQKSRMRPVIIPKQPTM